MLTLYEHLVVQEGTLPDGLFRIALSASEKPKILPDNFRDTQVPAFLTMSLCFQDSMFLKKFLGRLFISPKVKTKSHEIKGLRGHL